MAKSHIFEQHIVDYANGETLYLRIDFATLHLEFFPPGKKKPSRQGRARYLYLDEVYPNLAALDQAYRELVTPRLVAGDCFDIERSEPVSPMSSLLPLAQERGPTQKQNQPALQEPQEMFVRDLLAVVRTRLSQLPASAPATLTNLVFVLSDAKLTLLANAKTPRQKSDRALVAALRAQNDMYDWLKEARVLTAIDLEAWGQLPPNQAQLTVLLFLLCARLQANPLLAKIGSGRHFRVYLVEQDNFDQINPELRALAATHADLPAAEFLRLVQRSAK